MAMHSSSSAKEKKGVGRFLVTITVNGSSGPIRFPVSGEELVGAVIHRALKKYSQEGRLPVLGSDLNKLSLRCVNSGYDVLSPWEQIGLCGSRNFILCKEEKEGKEEEHGKGGERVLGRKGSGSWKALIKTLGFMIPSH
ncbi:uncharacterized protein A4U43_C01F30660 [Asparagus officinalis]|uniref:DUF7054 domain-containing protein n=1 Tax=Asparagus officinalis TaxID=4686 RepID=A0A5P1FWZ9_ASPOF|nr:uncharacterized protein LOC109829193 [Asparagus officinalis]ONK81570.1 uncharacterized protein A4U43_C01F30660 [Asparagus officinalis]